MKNPLQEKWWSPYLVGVGIGVLSWFAFATVDQPLGITTAFENTAALGAKAAAPQIKQTNEYYADKEAEGKPPKINWEWMLVVGVFIGALLSSWLSGDRTRMTVPDLWKWRFGGSVARRFVFAFLGGAVMMFGRPSGPGLHQRPRHQRHAASWPSRVGSLSCWPSAWGS